MSTPVVGRWRIVEMEVWDADAIDLLGPASIEFDRNGQGMPAPGGAWGAPSGGRLSVAWTSTCWARRDQGRPTSTPRAASSGATDPSRTLAPAVRGRPWSAGFGRCAAGAPAAAAGLLELPEVEVHSDVRPQAVLGDFICKGVSWTVVVPRLSIVSATRRRSAGTSSWPGPLGLPCANEWICG